MLISCSRFSFGIIIGIFVLITARHEKFDHFDDYTYWVPDDGLRYPQAPPAVPDIIPPIVVPETDIYFAKSRIKMLEHFRLVSHFNERAWERRNEEEKISINRTELALEKYSPICQ